MDSRIWNDIDGRHIQEAVADNEQVTFGAARK
jgi:hypothetical protein